MRFGISIPNAFTDIRVLCDAACEAEASGWDGFFLWDHINAFDGDTIDPWIALAAIAASTSRIRIGTMVTPLARRRPWIVARQAVTLDLLSNGRVILGVGLGYPPDKEFADLGEDPDDRVRAEKLDESLEIIDGLWRGERFAFAGKHFRIDNARFVPRPVQRPRIPIWVAGMWASRAPFRRAARWDGAFPMKANMDPLTFEEVGAIKSYVERHRRSGDAHDFVISRDLPANAEAARAEAAAYAVAGVTWWIEGAYDRGELYRKARRVPPLDER